MNKRQEARIRKITSLLFDLRMEDERYRQLCIYSNPPSTVEEKRQHEMDWAVVRAKLHEAEMEASRAIYDY
jgi:hypothetical protein